MSLDHRALESMCEQRHQVHHSNTGDMASLTDLPEDILYLIAIYFSHDLATLCVLSVVTSTFRHATRGLLLKHNKDLSPEKKLILLPYATRNQELGALLTSWYLNLDDHDAGGAHAIPELKTVLALPALEELVLERSNQFYKFLGGTPGMGRIVNHYRQLREGRPVERDFECAFLDNAEYDFNNVRTVHLKHEFSTTEILRFMVLPGVREVKATALGIMRAYRLPQELADTTSNVTCLALGGGWTWSMEPETLHSILAIFPNLRELKCQVPVSAILTGPSGGTTVTRPVSPAGLSHALQPVRATLRKLELLNWRHKVPYDGTHMNLLNFAVLQELEIASSCLMPDGPPCVERNGVCGLLPPRLRHLKVLSPYPV
jgi:hypothetical protein